ncbi:hypothetical protein [Stutzerimonas kirkiae]|uniref:hypothetical protein n=1 Tax=Stutzerimonas kirkiae TaxID=2211392 RepID=UPI0013F15B7C|nr:hypothetical protein [Stutzerimonas kirkiae]
MQIDSITTGRLVAGAILALFGLAALLAPEQVGAWLGVERVSSTTSMRVVAGNNLIFGSMLCWLAAKGRSAPLFSAMLLGYAALSAALLVHGANTLVGLPASEARGYLFEAALMALVGLLLAASLVAARARTGETPWPLPKGVRVVACLLLAALGALNAASGARGAFSPVENALAGGVPYGLLWSVTLNTQIGAGFLALGLALLVAALRPRLGREVVLAAALVYSKTAAVLAYATLVIAMPLQVHAATIKGAQVLAAFALVTWLLWALVWRRRVRQAHATTTATGDTHDG